MGRTSTREPAIGSKKAVPPELRERFDLADMLEDELAGRIRTAEERAHVTTEQNRLNTVHAKLHAARRSALCLSGGGIRSATFGLGVFQTLARYRLLEQFDYLSTVSGGGYIGAWLSAWIKNAPGGLPEVVQGLNKDLREANDAKRDPESEAIRHLRRYSNYLTPKLGFFSSDTWTLVATVLRNVFLNWLMLIPIAACALMIPRVFASLATREGPSLGVILYVLGVALLYSIMGTAYAALDLPAWRKTGEGPDARESGDTDRGFAWFGITPLVLCALLVTLDWFWYLGSFPDDAAHFRRWNTPTGAWSFIYFAIAGTFPAGIMALAWRKRRITGRRREPLAMIVTAIVGGLALWWVLRWLFGGLVPYEFSAVVINYICFAPSLVLLVFLLMNFIYVVAFIRLTTTEDREWWARAAGWLLVMSLGWATISTIVLWGPIAVHVLLQDKSWMKTALASFGGITGVVTALLGHSTRSAAKKADANPRRSWLLPLGAIIFLLFLLVWIAHGTAWLQAKLFNVPVTTPVSDDYRYPPDFRAYYSAVVIQMEAWKILVLMGAFGLIGFFVGYVVNVNQFSLHAMYNARLTRAYLGASRAGRDRKPHWFTGFDRADKIDMWQLAERQGKTLFHVVNTAMNLVSGKELAWQERMARSFTISPLHCGSWDLGYRPSRYYDGGINLGSAITISGAAANPNMGYHSSPLVAILMTLFNVRLGWWAGNPGEKGKNSWFRKGPRHAALPLLAEAFGYTTAEFMDVNLSDGGHFENLGLYEMVLRRCHRIVVVDSGRDTSFVFDDLGNAIRKIRIDFGIRIDIVTTMLEPDEKGIHLARCAVGEIHYEEVDRDAPVGQLIYIKPVLRKDEPVDVRNYAAAHPEFPHETTSDQWFSESQLESYRMLARHTMEQILKDGKETPTMEEFFAHVKAEAATAEPATLEPELVRREGGGSSAPSSPQDESVRQADSISGKTARPQL